MKNILYSILFTISALLFNSCTEDTPIFIADLSSEEITFGNDFASEYLLSIETEDNIADRFIWNETTLGTNNDYEVQGSIESLFTTSTSIGKTNATNHPVLVGQLLSLAQELGLDDDPTTTDEGGNPNNSGTVYFRVKASIGNGGAGSAEIFSEIQSVNIKWIEKVELETGVCDAIYAVGGAIVDAGWNFPGIELGCSADIQKVKLKLTNDIFRFFSVVDDWGSGLNYAYYADKGYTIDENLENANDGDQNFNFVGTPGIYTFTIDNVNKTIALIPSGSLWAVGGAVPGGWGFNDDTIEFLEVSPNKWQASITLSNDVFRFFQTFNEWDINNNYTYYYDNGFTIDANLESDGSDDANFNFVGTPGTYTLTIDANEKTITLE